MKSLNFHNELKVETASIKMIITLIIRDIFQQIISFSGSASICRFVLFQQCLSSIPLNHSSCLQFHFHDIKLKKLSELFLIKEFSYNISGEVLVKIMQFSRNNPLDTELEIAITFTYGQFCIQLIFVRKSSAIKGFLIEFSIKFFLK